MTLVLQGKTVTHVTAYSAGRLCVWFEDGLYVVIDRDGLLNGAGNREPVVCDDDDRETLIGHANRISTRIDSIPWQDLRTRYSMDFDRVCAILGKPGSYEDEDEVRCPENYCSPPGFIDSLQK
jgi:hypothetical protein